MRIPRAPWHHSLATELADEVLQGLAAVRSERALRTLISDVTKEMGFLYFALITHEDLRLARPGQVDIRHYPEAASDRIIGKGQFRRDPVMRSCVFADSAFIWSELNRYVLLDKRDRAILELGAREGLNEGITVPCSKLGHSLGSCTFAGTRQPEKAKRLLGASQIIGIFTFQTARRLAGFVPLPALRPRLNPRPRDCVVLAGRGLSNKEIARALNLAPRTIDGYLTEARRRFGASDRTELVVAAVLAGEVGLNELR